jgi:hypothetical protein
MTPPPAPADTHDVEALLALELEQKLEIHLTRDVQGSDHRRRVRRHDVSVPPVEAATVHTRANF